MKEASFGPTWQLINSTLLDNPVGVQVDALNFSNQPMNITDCIIADAAGTGVAVSTVLSNDITINTSALVQGGPYALAMPTVDVNTPSKIVLGTIVTADPEFVSVTPGRPSFFSVYFLFRKRK